MPKQAFLVAFLLFVASPLTVAQSNCPEGFRYAGSLSGSGSSMTPFDQRVRLRLPENATLDTSFQQKKVRATNGSSGVSSTLRAHDLPKGILIITHGKSDRIYEQGWAVSDPELKVLEQDSNGKVTHYEFGMHLFCKVGEQGANPQFGECSVTVEVCYKQVR